MLRLAFGLAVRHEVIHRNPIDGVARLHKPKRTPTALTATEVNAIRAVIRAWELSRGTSGPNPDGQLGQIVEVMLGTSARIGGPGDPPTRSGSDDDTGHAADLRHGDLRKRRGDLPPGAPFRSREGTPLTTANMRRQLRKVLGDAGMLLDAAFARQDEGEGSDRALDRPYNREISSGYA